MSLMSLMIMGILLCLNTFDAHQMFTNALDDGLPSFYRVFPNVDSAGFDYYHEEDYTYLPDSQQFDLEEIVQGSLFFKKYADVDPVWFWDFDALGLSAEVLESKIKDKFGLSSSHVRVDENINSSYTFAYIISELLYIKTLLCKSIAAASL